MDSDGGQEFVFAVENVVKDVGLSQSGCEEIRHGLVMIDSGASVNVCRNSSTPRCGRKNTPRLRKASNMAEDRKQLETVRLPCGGGDEADPECQLLVRERNRNTPREKPFPEVRRQTRTPVQEKLCVVRQGADRSQSQGHNRVMRTSRRFTRVTRSSRRFTNVMCTS